MARNCKLIMVQGMHVFRAPSLDNVFFVQDVGTEAVTVVCRICEETVPASHLDEHTVYCQSVHQLDNKTATTDVRLRKFVEALKQRREQVHPQQVSVNRLC